MAIAVSLAEHTANERARSFHLLDVFRGIAAISVITLHFPQAFAPLVADGAYLAVDLFFLMSGFVLARAYEAKLHAGMTGRSFLLARLVRLFPFYLLALLPSAIELAYYYRAEALSWQVAGSIGLSMVMLPTPAVGFEHNPLFPANFVTWSLFFELLANALYVGTLRTLSGRLMLLIGPAAAIVLAVAIGRGNLNGGAYWPDAYVAVVRVVFSFFAGVGLFRVHAAGRLPQFRVPSLVLTTAAVLALALHVPPPWRGWFDAGCALMLFPALLIAAIAHPPCVPNLISRFLGEISYPIYVLQLPVFTLLVMGLPKLAPGLLTASAPWTGTATLAVLASASWLLAVHVDAPLRRRLVRSLTERDDGVVNEAVTVTVSPTHYSLPAKHQERTDGGSS